MFDEMFSKTTKNFAAKRNLDIDAVGSAKEYILISAIKSDYVPKSVSYTTSGGAEVFPLKFYVNSLVSDEAKTELPAYINNEKHLRSVMEFISKSI